jgi:transmembrane sensor
MMRNPREHELRIAAEAAQWQHTLRRAGTEECSQFVDWVRASPRHLQEFLFMEALEAATDTPDADRHIDVEKLLAEAKKNVVPLGETERATSRHRPLSQWGGAVAAALLVALASWFGLRSGETFATAIGEQRTIELEDGSLVELNAYSRMRVRLSGERRDVQLLDGEAMFKVTPDPTRPFQVRTGATVIQVLGTQFNVKHRASETVVSVIAGKVAIGKTELAAGDEAQIAHAGGIVRKPLDLVEVSAWRHRRLVFRDDTLEEIAAEFNRYNKSPRIVVEGDDARAKRFGGTFDADDPQAITEVLAGNSALAIQRTDDAIIISAR